MKAERFFYMKFILLSGILLISAAVIGNVVNQGNAGVFAAADRNDMCIIVDPGHGGEDGGCVSADGILEKKLNLEVSYKVSEILKAMGYNTVMTRTEDKMLYDMYGDDKIIKKKTYDLKNRLKFARENDADLFVSIHMNKFPESQYKGLQVYYSPNNSESGNAAELIQHYTKEYLQKDNERQTKKADKSIYLLDRIDMPGVLVECGFLSNPEDTKMLCDEDYQRKLSFVIACAVVEYFES